ncbi:hypothetical protein EVAR_98360_1, partial [Eumeta japonica]
MLIHLEKNGQEHCHETTRQGAYVIRHCAGAGPCRGVIEDAITLNMLGDRSSA